MASPISTPRPLETERSPWLRGSLKVPGDVTLTVLAMVAAALAHGESRIEGAFAGPETAAIAAALGELGVRTDFDRAVWRISGMGIGGLLAPRRPLDADLSPLVASLLMGLCGTSDFETTVTGDPELVTHFDTMIEQLRRFGVVVTAGDKNRLPVALKGPPIALPAEIELPANASASKAALLIAALHSPAISTFTEHAMQPNHAERMLSVFGAGVTIRPREDGGRTIEAGGLPQMQGRTVRIPGDPSLAAIAAIAASIVPSSDLRIEDVLVNPTRTMFLSALVAMGASIEAHSLRIEDGEEIADLVIRHAPLHGIALGQAHVGAMLDDVPYLAVAAACAVGETVLHLPRAMPIEASARIAATARELVANGIECEATEETFIIAGTGEARGRGRVITGQDPVISMAFLVLGMAAREQVTIDDQTGIEERFPGFVELFEAAGASFVRLT